MSYKEVFAQLDLMKGKKVFSETETQQLVKIYARLQRERDELRDKEKKFTKLDLFNLQEEEGKRFGSPAAAKADLRIRLSELAKSAGMSDGELQQRLQGRIDIGKSSEITKIVKETNKRQTEFLFSETQKAFWGGAAMGFAGGILAQEAIHLGGEQVEKLWGGHYFKSHGTNFDRIRDWVKGSHIYQSHFGHGTVAGAAVNHGGGMWHSRDASAHEWVSKIDGHVSGGGQVEHIHTHDWYDNNSLGQSPAEHIHNANELKFFINKDTVGSLHFKVPVDEQGGSWVIHGNHFEPADLQKAFADGHIKMIFVPDGSGSGAHEAVTFQINPVTKELIVPPDSNIRNLFDDNGVFKGNGYFGLAEQIGTNKDGSTIYNWINSQKGNGGNINFGQNAWQDDIRIVGAPAAETVSDYNSPTIATVPPQRKVFMRPEERAKANEKKNKKEQEKAKKRRKRGKEKRQKIFGFCRGAFRKRRWRRR